MGKGFTIEECRQFPPYPDRPAGSEAVVKPTVTKPRPIFHRPGFYISPYICTVFHKDDPIIAHLRSQLPKPKDVPWQEATNQFNEKIFKQYTTRIKLMGRLAKGVREITDRHTYKNYLARGMVPLGKALRIDVYQTTEIKIHNVDPMINSRPWRFLNMSYIRRWLAEDGKLMSERPIRVYRNEGRQPHNSTGPAIEYPSGTRIYAINGIQIQREWITDPQSVTVRDVFNQLNAEVRRIGCNLLGWDRILQDIDATLVDEDGDPMIGTLYEGVFPEPLNPEWRRVDRLLHINRPRDPVRCGFLKVLCGTGRTFVIPVPPGMSTAMEAQAWIQGVTVEDWRKPEVRG